jgi:hypothetical protein
VDVQLPVGLKTYEILEVVFADGYQD